MNAGIHVANEETEALGAGRDQPSPLDAQDGPWGDSAAPGSTLRPGGADRYPPETRKTHQFKRTLTVGPVAVEGHHVGRRVDFS